MIINKEISLYLNQMLPDRDPILEKMENVAKEEETPVIGPQVGRLLFQLTLTIQARRILQLGTGIGYATIWLARGVTESGIVYSVANDIEKRRRAEAFCNAAGLEQRVKFVDGGGLQEVDGIDGQFDMIFNNVAKYQYPQVFYKTAAHVRQGGLLISNGVLWGGRVAGGEDDDWSEALRLHNRLVSEAPDFLTTLIPLGDGLSISLKLYS